MNANRIDANIALIGNLVTTLSSFKFLVKFLSMISPLCNEMYVINDGALSSHDNIVVVPTTRLCSIIKQKSNSNLARLYFYLVAQLGSSIGLLKCLRKVRYIVVFPAVIFLPVMLGKVTGRKIILYEAQDVVSAADQPGLPARMRYSLMVIGRRIALGLSDLIVVEGPSVVMQNGISKYTSKIQACPQYIDTSYYGVRTKFPDRPMQVGFVGTLENRKGAIEFAEAARRLASVNPDILFAIVGKGTLFPRIEQICSKIPNKDSIRLIREIREDLFPSFLNELRLVVVPSKSEGLPNIVLECMASGTPVLATKVGAIPDVIQHELTGFLLDCNSADCVSREIMMALGHPRLGIISSAARTLMETEYSYTRALERWSACLRRL